MFIREGDAGDPPSADPCVFMPYSSARQKATNCLESRDVNTQKELPNFVSLAGRYSRLFPTGLADNHLDILTSARIEAFTIRAMSGRLSTRLSIRWVPGEPSEPTDTLVISVGGWYVDLRITKADGSIDWGMAGERLVLSQEPCKSCAAISAEGRWHRADITPVTYKWTHWIDSNGYTEPDVGSFTPTSVPTDSVETGSMLNPETNTVTPYEEVWRILPVSSPETFGYAWILRSGDGKTFLGRVGGDFLALKGGQEGPVGMKGFCARRETWDQGTASWRTLYEAGDQKNIGSLSKIADCVDSAWEKSSKVGDTVNAFGGEYVVCAIEAAK